MSGPVVLERFAAADGEHYSVRFNFAAMVPGVDYRITVPGQILPPRVFIYRRSGKGVDIFEVLP